MRPTHRHLSGTVKAFLKTGQLLIAGLFLISVSAQAGPVPFFRNYSSLDYDSMSQNWSIAQDGRGIIYIGNNSCLLRFNGKGWDKIYPFGTENEAIIRSLYADEESGRLYLGSFNEFGYMEYDEFGEMTYTSLYPRDTESGYENDEIWFITRIRDQVFFIYFSSFYIYDLKSGDVHRFTGNTAYYYAPDSYLYLASANGVVRRFDGSSLTHDTMPQPEIPGNVLKIFTDEDGGQIAVTVQDGIFKAGSSGMVRVDGEGDRWGVANRAIQCRDGSVVVGFLSRGVCAYGPDGRRLWSVSTDSGLIDDTVLALLEDDCGNIWCALDNGIAEIFKGGDFMLSLAEYDLGKTTVSLYSGDELFVGTKQGLATFRITGSDLNISKTGSYFHDSQLWSLHEIDGQIFIGEDRSTYAFSNGQPHLISYAPGGIVPKTATLADGTEVLIQGSFTLLYVYVKENGKWVFSHTVDGFLKPVKNLEVDYLGNLWVEHMYHGLFRLVLSADGHTVSSESEFQLRGAKVCKMGGRVLFHNKDGFHYFDERSSAMVPFDEINDKVGRFRNCNRVIHAGGDRYWLISTNEAALIRFHNDSAEVIDNVNCADFNVNLTELFETILSLPGERYLFGIEDGFLVHDVKAEDSLSFDKTPNIFLSEITTYHNETSEKVSLNSERIVLKHRSSLDLSIFVTGIKYHRPEVLYEMSDYDYKPRKLDKTSHVIYQRLHAGSYVFRCWINDDFGNRMAEMELPVIVRPSVYASVPAIIAYILFAGLLLMTGVLVARRALTRQKARLEAEKKSEIISLRNEQLEESLLLKSKELATYSLMELRRNKVLEKLSAELTQIRYSKPGAIPKGEYDKLMSIIKEGEFSEDSWNHFYQNFDLIHQSFFRSLSARHPDLTSNDLRICAYLRLNMTTKELADVMGVTLKGAEAAKYRLRKKLGIDTSIPLHSYLMHIN